MLVVALLLCAVTTSTATVLPLNLTQFVGKRALFVVAHPDDIEGLAGGLVYLLTQQGTEVSYLIATNGDKGGTCYINPGHPCTKEELAYTRYGEQLAAANYLKVSTENVRFLDLEDGMLDTYPEREVRLQMISHMRTFRPHVVFTWFLQPNLACKPGSANAPYNWGDLGYHPDHMAAGRICFDAIRGFGVSSELLFDELSSAGIHAWKGLEQFYLFSLTSQDMTHYVDIGAAAVLSAKVKANLLHKSQYGFVDPKMIEEGVKWIAGEVAKAAGGQVTYAEGFTAFF